MAGSRTITGRIDSWFKGMSDDVRIQDFASFFLSVHNNIFGHLKRVTPYPNTEDNSTDKANQRIERFLYYSSKLYGLGQVSSASAVGKIYEKSSNIVTDSWTASGNGADSTGSRSSSLFIEYKGFIYYLVGGSRINAYDPAGAGATHGSGDVALSLSYGSYPSQGLVTSQDLLLVPYGNKIAVKDGGTSYNDNWESARLTLPSNMIIVDLEEFGNLIAITCRATNISNNSKVFLWDQISPDVSETIDIGEGIGIISANLEGELYTVVDVGSASNLTAAAKLVLRRYIGNKTSEVVSAIDTETYIASYASPISNGTSTTKIKESNRVSFVIQTTIDGTSRINMWTVGRKKAGYPVALTMSQNINNDTQPTSIQGAFKVGDYYFYSINGDGTILRTNNDATFTATSTYITQKINGEELVKDASQFRKQLRWAGITCPSLPAGSTVSLYHRVDATTSWTKIFDLTTTNTMIKQSGKYADDSDFLIGYEHQFKLTTVGGTALPAEWASIDYQLDILDGDISE